MSGIAGIDQPGKQATVKRMLEKISHRGNAGKEVRGMKNATFGIVCADAQVDSLVQIRQKNEVADGYGAGHLALVKANKDGIILKRDHLGVAPLYYGESEEGAICFASEVKALISLCSEIKSLPPGCKSDGERLETYFQLKKREPLDKKVEFIAEELKELIKSSIEKRIEQKEEIGSWLSGGLDSSTLAALTSLYVRKLYTFATGLDGSPDLEYAREVANYIGSEHHEVVVEFSDLLSVLPDVIFHLESFDALLVRSSIMNFLVAEKASEYVYAVLSGEGGDELFAGYHYLKNLKQEELPDELIDIMKRLHNTALQRVDRSASAHGTVAHVCFLDPDVVNYALRIPPEMKLHENVEKWILRVAMDGELPEKILNRKKAKFWKGAGVKNLMLHYADKTITDDDFRLERNLKNGWIINSKEELMYYRIFKEHFGKLEDLSWMGRTKVVRS
ncbi:MAG: asparagine synthase [Candidatus Aminicenantes bacterium]|nr:asparagine synthase [Candidatus Aminicenantes bacterium]MBL7082641.1 asparagine synthase [Candidatus Aminicenantes bacterium]